MSGVNCLALIRLVMFEVLCLLPVNIESRLVKIERQFTDFYIFIKS